MVMHRKQKYSVDLSRANSIICMQVTAHFHLIMFYHLGFWLYPSYFCVYSYTVLFRLYSAEGDTTDREKEREGVREGRWKTEMRCDMNKKNGFKIMFPDQNCSSFSSSVIRVSVLPMHRIVVVCALRERSNEKWNVGKQEWKLKCVKNYWPFVWIWANGMYLQRTSWLFRLTEIK